MGPGKADLLEAIAREGSISAATRALGMSYRRGWLLVDTMNRCFARPLVAARPGGGGKAGATLTPEGKRALAAYRDLARQVERGASGEAWQTLEAAIRPSPSET